MTNEELLYKLAGLMYAYDQQQEKGYDVCPVHEVYELVDKWWEDVVDYPCNPEKEQSHE